MNVNNQMGLINLGSQGVHRHGGSHSCRADNNSSVASLIDRFIIWLHDGYRPKEVWARCVSLLFIILNVLIFNRIYNITIMLIFIIFVYFVDRRQDILSAT